MPDMSKTDLYAAIRHDSRAGGGSCSVSTGLGGGRSSMR